MGNLEFFAEVPDIPSSSPPGESLLSGLRWFQVRFSTTTGSVQPFVNGATQSEFTWATSSGILPFCSYVQVQTIPAHFPTNRNEGTWNYFGNYTIALTNAEALRLFGSQSEITQDILFLADIQKFFQVHYPSMPFNVGLQLTSTGAIAMNASQQVIPTATQTEFTSGATVLTAAPYSPQYPTRVHFNLYNTAVRRYLALSAAKYADSFHTTCIALDNVVVHGNVLPYVRGSDAVEEATNYGRDYDDILSQISSANYRISANALREGRDFELAFQQIIVNGLHYDSLMIEDDWICHWYSGSECDLPKVQTGTVDYLALAEFLRLRGKKLMFAAGNFPTSFFPGSTNPKRAWLWLSLIANGAVYASLSPNYVYPSPYYSFYATDLGDPLTSLPVRQTDGSWVRQYEHGTIHYVEPTQGMSAGNIWLEQ
jgi:hypothetical protein